MKDLTGNLVAAASSCERISAECYRALGVMRVATDDIQREVALKAIFAEINIAKAMLDKELKEWVRIDKSCTLSATAVALEMYAMLETTYAHFKNIGARDSARMVGEILEKARGEE